MMVVLFKFLVKVDFNPPPFIPVEAYKLSPICALLAGRINYFHICAAMLGL